MIKLITSGAYISSELIAELGNLPPSFLPVGNKRLYEYQVEFLNQICDGDIYISLPSDYIIPPKDLEFFSREKIQIISTNSEINISESITYSLKKINRYGEKLIILHGDTYIKNNLPPLADDLAVVSETTDNYKWGYNSNNDNVYVGLFFISLQREFLFYQREKSNNFLHGINTYFRRMFGVLYNIDKNDWLDFGHLNTFFRSRSQISTVRHFNNFQSDGSIVTKTSTNIKKILAESFWYKEVPERISLHSPKLLGELENGYKLEYLYLLPLSEIFVFGNLPINIWKQIFLSCGEFLSLCENYKIFGNREIIKKIYVNKTVERITEFSLQRDFSLSKEVILNGKEFPSILSIAMDCIEYLTSHNNWNQQTVIHGDFCFSNILYNFRSQSVKVIDPRGLDAENNFSLYGDSNYDLAKLAHSVIGGYDFIISNYQTCGEINFSLPSIEIIDFKYYSPPHLEKIREIFIQLFLDTNVKRKQIYAIMVLLFLSMLPLHLDYPSKQEAMLATAVKLYGDIKK